MRIPHGRTQLHGVRGSDVHVGTASPSHSRLLPGFREAAEGACRLSPPSCPPRLPGTLSLTVPSISRPCWGQRDGDPPVCPKKDANWGPEAHPHQEIWPDSPPPPQPLPSELAAGSPQQAPGLRAAEHWEERPQVILRGREDVTEPLQRPSFPFWARTFQFLCQPRRHAGIRSVWGGS